MNATGMLKVSLGYLKGDENELTLRRFDGAGYRGTGAKHGAVHKVRAPTCLARNAVGDSPVHLRNALVKLVTAS